MPVVKQRQIPTGTVKLKQLKNDLERSNNRYKYVIDFPDGDRMLAGFTKVEGKEAFDRTVRQRQQGGGQAGALGAVNTMDRTVQNIFSGGGRF